MDICSHQEPFLGGEFSREVWCADGVGGHFIGLPQAAEVEDRRVIGLGPKVGIWV
ncbi:MAG: hypothetical protein AAGN35_00720 [Bacteroidota bacterium]